MGADKLAENTPNAQKFMCPNCMSKPKSLGFRWKRLHWASVVRVWMHVQSGEALLRHNNVHKTETQNRWSYDLLKILCLTSFKVNVNPLLNQLLKASQQRAADQEMFDLSTDQLEASCKVNWKSEFRTNISILVKTAVHDMLHQSRISKLNEFCTKKVCLF